MNHLKVQATLWNAAGGHKMATMSMPSVTEEARGVISPPDGAVQRPPESASTRGHGSTPVSLASAAPMAALSIMVLTAYLLIGTTVDCDLSFIEGGKCALPGTVLAEGVTTSAFEELRARLVWALTVLLSVLTIGCAIGAATVLLRRVENPRKRRRMRGTILLAGLVFAGTNFGWRLEGTYAFSKELIGKTVFRVSYANHFVTVIEVLGQTALVALAVVVGIIAAAAERDHRRVDITPDERTATLARDLREIRLLLLLGAAGLAAAVLETAALYEWARTIRGASNYIALTEDAARTMGAVLGAYYSILLAAIFAPVLFRLQAWVHRAADGAGKVGSERTAWMQENGLDVSLPRHVVSALAVLAPLLAGGPVAELIAAIVG